MRIEKCVECKREYYTNRKDFKKCETCIGAERRRKYLLSIQREYFGRSFNWER